MHAAVIQLNSTGDKERNLETAEGLVRAASMQCAGNDGLVVLPEKWNLLAAGEELAAGAEPLDGPSLTAARSWAASAHVSLLAGSICERGEDGRLYNTSVLIDGRGDDLAVYRKIHMFDVEVDGVAYRESEYETPGEEIVSAQLPYTDRVVGLSVCYDLRFPELYRILALRGAQVLTVPSAFTAATGRDHWETLLRARAIENQAFVLAANQIGKAPPHFDSYGRSMIVDPRGVVLATAPDDERFVMVELDFLEFAMIRNKLPSLANRRPRAYVWPQETEVSA